MFYSYKFFKNIPGVDPFLVKLLEEQVALMDECLKVSEKKSKFVKEFKEVNINTMLLAFLRDDDLKEAQDL